MTLATVNALAWGIRQCKTLRQIKFRFSKQWTPSSMMSSSSTSSSCSSRDNDNNSNNHCFILFKDMVANKHVSSINLDDNDMDAGVCAEIVDLMIHTPHTRVSRLTLERNPIGDAGTKSLIRMMERAHSLRYLNLGWNSMTDDGVVKLVRAAAKTRKRCLLELTGMSTATQSHMEHYDAEQLDGDVDVHHPSIKHRRLMTCNDDQGNKGTEAAVVDDDATTTANKISSDEPSHACHTHPHPNT